MKENTLNKINSYIKLAAICCLLLVLGCKAKKVITATPLPPVSTNITVKPVDTTRLKLEVVRAGQSNFNTFSGKAKAKLDIDGSTNDVTLTIRVKRDKKIWVSVTAIAGIEVARAVITPDSILMINRLQTVYLKKPFSYINALAGNQVNYKTIESLLVGNIMPELLNSDTNIQTGADNTVLSGTLQDLVYKLIVSGAAMKATQTNLNNQSEGQSLQVNNGAFIQIGPKTIPTQIDIASVVNDKKIRVNLHYTKTDFDIPLDFPFSIPARYTEAN
jgi:hypothetical protein